MIDCNVLPPPVPTRAGNVGAKDERQPVQLEENSRISSRPVKKVGNEADEGERAGVRSNQNTAAPPGDPDRQRIRSAAPARRRSPRRH
jgi:hypothetical protein